MIKVVYTMHHNNPAQNKKRVQQLEQIKATLDQTRRQKESNNKAKVLAELITHKQYDDENAE